MYQMKLSRSAQHEPVRGFWCRVCETCYKSREGYSDRHGLERERMSEYSKLRQERLDKRTMEVSRLEKRLTRLTQLLANPPDDIPQPQQQTKRWSLAAWTQNDPRKALEQSVVSWQNDADVARCPYCQQDFTQYTFRRHHCRTCGKVVCGDPATGCSIVLPLTVATSKSSSNSSSYTDQVQLTRPFSQKSHHPLTPFLLIFVSAKNATTPSSLKKTSKKPSPALRPSLSPAPTTIFSSSNAASAS
jgi:rabenosyn-5